jgi:hypothetical protein
MHQFWLHRFSVTYNPVCAFESSLPELRLTTRILKSKLDTPLDLPENLEVFALRWLTLKKKTVFFALLSELFLYSPRWGVLRDVGYLYRGLESRE